MLLPNGFQWSHDSKIMERRRNRLKNYARKEFQWSHDSKIMEREKTQATQLSKMRVSMEPRFENHAVSHDYYSINYLSYNSLFNLTLSIISEQVYYTK